MEGNMEHVKRSINLREDEIINGLKKKGWAAIDDFLGSDVCDMYRQEAVGFYERKDMTISKSTRWDNETNSVVTYDKHNVFATQLNGGDSYYDGPRLHEYVVSIVKSLVPIISEKFPEAHLSPLLASNKLAVCTGDGSSYDKHYDNSGGDDLRKLTVLYYLNPNWRTQLGGAFRIYNSVLTPSSSTPEVATAIEQSSNDSDHTNVEVTDINPIGDRLLIFWSDRLVHSVQPSQAPAGDADHRYAFTVWITSENAISISNSDTDVNLHFSNQGLQG
eukprot:CAMPEP_0119051420 /NCGR_PEP_ID=MMETSP1177-20130426/73041_1 /TAXON_ID=2985 /ORGANISM="Ochromonas sp, Strain CCMP1899" /LENGTH=274 /DNA_ID=CAMNT_0007030613 /DNA_START=248 /DNA_END=1072 /DNA_ORIENTATION=+